jgi:hypothetical protein
MEELCFLSCPCRDVISKGPGQFSQFSTGVCEERTWARGRGIAIVRAIIRKLLVKIFQAIEDLACSDYKICKPPIVLYLFVGTPCKWPINSFTHPNPQESPLHVTIHISLSNRVWERSQKPRSAAGSGEHGLFPNEAKNFFTSHVTISLPRIPLLYGLRMIVSTGQFYLLRYDAVYSIKNQPKFRLLHTGFFSALFY